MQPAHDCAAYRRGTTAVLCSPSVGCTLCHAVYGFLRCIGLSNQAALACAQGELPSHCSAYPVACCVVAPRCHYCITQAAADTRPRPPQNLCGTPPSGDMLWQEPRHRLRHTKRPAHRETVRATTADMLECRHCIPQGYPVYHSSPFSRPTGTIQRYQRSGSQARGVSLQRGYRPAYPTAICLTLPGSTHRTLRHCQYHRVHTSLGSRRCVGRICQWWHPPIAPALVSLQPRACLVMRSTPAIA